MALNDNAVFTAATGYVLVAPVGTAYPTVAEIEAFDPEAEDNGLLAAWEEIGHTSSEDLPEFGYDGGDTESRGTWQKKSLREVTTDPAVDYVTIGLQQFDQTTLEYYFGPNVSVEDGVYGIDRSDAPAIERAILIIVIDGNNKMAFAATKASIRRDDSIEMATDEFATMPVRATFLKQTGMNLFRWIMPVLVP